MLEAEARGSSSGGGIGSSGVSGAAAPARARRRLAGSPRLDAELDALLKQSGERELSMCRPRASRPAPPTAYPGSYLCHWRTCADPAPPAPRLGPGTSAPHLQPRTGEGCTSASPVLTSPPAPSSRYVPQLGGNLHFFCFESKHVAAAAAFLAKRPARQP